MFENKTAKEPIRREKNDHFVAHDNEPYPWHRSLYVFNYVPWEPIGYKSKK